MGPMTRTACILLGLTVALGPACGGTKFVGVEDDAGDDGATDGGARDGNAQRDAGACAKLTISENCAQDGDCAFLAHQIDCCGTMQFVGINGAFKTQAQAAEGALEAACGKCGCPASPATAQDGHVVLESSHVTVRCDSQGGGQRACRTSAL
jgi:hypothetical protein